MAGVTAFFHRGLCPLCGGGFRRCRFETLLFTPTEEQRQMPSGLPPLRLWRGKDCKKGTPVNPGCFCFSGKYGGESACVGAVLGKTGLWHTDPAHWERQGVAPRRGTPENPGCFCFSGKCSGESACVGAVLGKRGSGILTRLTGDARELLPAGAVQPVPCRLSKIRAAVRHTETFRFSLFTLH